MILEKEYQREKAVMYARKYALVRNPKRLPCVKGAVKASIFEGGGPLAVEGVMTEGLFENEVML